MGKEDILVIGYEKSGTDITCLIVSQIEGEHLVSKKTFRGKKAEEVYILLTEKE